MEASCYLGGSVEASCYLGGSVEAKQKEDTSMDVIEIIKHPRVKVGWVRFPEIVEHLAKINAKIPLLYMTETNELIITDRSLIDVLRSLDIPITYSTPNNSVRFIKESG